MGKYIDGSGLSHFMGILKGIHQTFVTNVAYDSTSKKITKTINGSSSDVVTLSTVATSGSYNDLSNKPSIPSANSTATNIKMDGTQSAGSLTTFAKADHVHPSDTSRVPTTRKINNKALSADVTLSANDIRYNAYDWIASSNVQGAIEELEEYFNSRAPIYSPDFSGIPTAPTAAAGTNTAQIATTAFVTSAVGAASAGALIYKGTVNAESTITGASYKKGWYYVVSAAGTYVGKVCEVGDMLIAKQDKTSTPANDWDAVQSNIEVLSNSEIDTLWAAA